MQALISTTEPRQTGYRVAQVTYDDQIFPVAETMFWVVFPDTLNSELVSMDAYYFDPMDNTIKLQYPPQDITEE
jgi:hypothetical protein